MSELLQLAFSLLT